MRMISRASFNSQVFNAALSILVRIRHSYELVNFEQMNRGL